MTDNIQGGPNLKGLTKELRRFITLNGNPFVELDYSGLHIRFAYHLKGLDYRDDPYGFCGEDDTVRIPYKLAVLILINSGARPLAVKAIRKAFLDEMRRRRRDSEGADLLSADQRRNY
jgi:hypothetical protein